MATSTEEMFRRRVQSKIAGEFLKEIDPDALKDPDRYKGEGGPLSAHMDLKTQKEFERKFEKYRTKTSAFNFQNILWLLAAMAVFHFTDFVLVLRYDPRIDRLWFNIGAILIAINLSIAFFLVVWLTFIKKISSDNWERMYPAAIPIASAAFLGGGICLMVGLWPVWGFLTPPILFIIFMGFVVVIAMFG
ncbi:transmembrane protein 128-like [Gigantopelta aegis]|uniref:transmembrane protein 128-like n=1 Tax=Gigantopelta aegis TaxID=1735272 RepID=UPI001B88DB68|nr:transmembrane protein 128-like [Gigantopelta aegis]